MKLTLDASVAAKWVQAEIGSDSAQRIRDDFRNGVHELIAPDIFCIEVAHTLVRAERKKLITDMPQHFADIMSLCPDLADSPQSARPRNRSGSQHPPRSVRLHLRSLAERENAPLVTADSQLLNLSGYPVLDLATF